MAYIHQTLTKHMEHRHESCAKEYGMVSSTKTGKHLLASFESYFLCLRRIRLLSTCFGRPCLISLEQIQVPAPTDSSLTTGSLSAFAKHYSEGLVYFNRIT
jgi:hypothetical protein